MAELERRYTRVETDGGRRFRGTAIVFNALSVDLGGFQEIISPDAVKRTIHNGDEVHAFFDHDSGKVLGNTRAGTLLFRQERNGLHVNIDPPSWASWILESVDRGDIRGMSFGFRTKPEWVTWDFDLPIPVRTVHDMEFSEVSIVAKPAYRQTDINVAQRELRAIRDDQARAGNRIAFLEKRMRLARARS